MPPPAIVSHLRKVLEAEKVEHEAEALPAVARAAAGSMRDALSLLDQAIAHGGGRVSASSVGEMLGAIDQSYLLRLAETLCAGDGAGAVAIADEMQARSLSFDAALADLAGLFLRVALAQSVPEALEQDLPERQRIVALAGRADPETVQLYYQIALQGRQDLPLAPDEHAGFVMTLLRVLAFRPADASTGAFPAPAQAPKAATPTTREARDWPELVQQLPLAGAARELARHAELRQRENGSFDLVVPKSKAYLAERGYQEKLKAALEQHLGAGVSVKVTVGEVAGATAAALEAGEREARRSAAAQSLRSDGFVKELVNLFDGKVVDSTIREDRK
jgi:DNA polymerase-3 subunit gamma/tau